MSISLSPSRYWPIVAAADDGARGLGDGLAGHAQRARLVLVDLQAQHLDRLVPVVVDAAQVRVGAHDRLHLVGAARAPWPGRARRRGTAPGTAPAARWAAAWRGRAPPGTRWPAARAAACAAPRAPPGPWAARSSARRWSAGRSGRAAGRSAATPVPTQVVTWSTPSSLHACAPRRAWRSPRWPRRTVPSGSHRSTRISGRLESGKNCFCTLPMPTMPSTKRADGQADGDPAVLHAPVHQRAKARVERRVEQLVRLAGHVAVALVLEQQRAEVGHEVHRHQPRDQQRRRRDREDREGVLARPSTWPCRSAGSRPR